MKKIALTVKRQPFASGWLCCYMFLLVHSYDEAASLPISCQGLCWTYTRQLRLRMRFTSVTVVALGISTGCVKSVQISAAACYVALDCSMEVAKLLY